MASGVGAPRGAWCGMRPGRAHPCPPVGMIYVGMIYASRQPEVSASDGLISRWDDARWRLVSRGLPLGIVVQPRI
jgi:hypothetical protein